MRAARHGLHRSPSLFRPSAGRSALLVSVRASLHASTRAAAARGAWRCDARRAFLRESPAREGGSLSLTTRYCARAEVGGPARARPKCCGLAACDRGLVVPTHKVRGAFARTATLLAAVGCGAAHTAPSPREALCRSRCIPAARCCAAPVGAHRRSQRAAAPNRLRRSCWTDARLQRVVVQPIAAWCGANVRPIAQRVAVPRRVREPRAAVRGAACAHKSPARLWC